MVNRQNYLKVKDHLKYLGEVLQISPISLERYRFCLRHLLLWADSCLFVNSWKIRPAFPSYINSLPGKNGKGQLSLESQKKMIEISKRFFQWAKTSDPKEFNQLPPTWIDTLRIGRTPQISKENIYVGLEEAVRLAAFPVDQEELALRRDQAAAAMLFLSGMRAHAFVTLPIAAVDLKEHSIRQWPELGVKTKNGKMATTFLLPVAELLLIVEAWDELVRAKLPPEAMWYAPVDHTWGEQRLSAGLPGKNRQQALDKRLRVLYQQAGLQYKSAHKFRHGHAVYGLTHARTIADYKAVSMNLMHEDIKITDQVYAPILSGDVKQRISTLSSGDQNLANDELMSLIGRLSNGDLSKVLEAVVRRLAS